MKKIVFLSLALLVCTLCSAKKPVKKRVQKKTAQERYMDSLKFAMEIKLIQAEMELEDMKHRAKMEEQELELPCMTESNDTPEYYGGFGVGEGKTEQEAMQEALREAVSYIEQRGISSIQVIDSVKTIVWAYRDSIDLSNVRVDCRKLYLESNGEFKCYIAVHIPKLSNSNLSNEKIEISEEYLDSVKMELKAILEEYNKGVSRNAKSE